ncbi:uncharacterized protein [Parasteatoda tepidariorum]|uniref:uncharacterized protein isoform X3 n=1 Tax=Parasteatoda tepidariorum TaxID=114398 RepID=UPI0039BC6205
MDSEKKKNYIEGCDEIDEIESKPKDLDSKSLRPSSSSKSQIGDDAEKTFDVDEFIESACGLRSDPMPLLMAEQPNSSERDSVTDSPNCRPGVKKTSVMLDESVMASWLSESSSDSHWSIDQEDNDRQKLRAEDESDMEEFETKSSSNGNTERDINKNHDLPNQNVITYNLIDLDVRSEIETTNMNHFGKKYSDNSDKVLCSTTNCVNKIFKESLNLLSNLTGKINSGSPFGETLKEGTVSQSDDNLPNSKSNVPNNYGTVLKESRTDIRENSKEEPDNVKTKMKIEFVIESDDGNVNPSDKFGTRLVRAFGGRIITQPDFNSPNWIKYGAMPKELRDVEYRIKKSKSKTGKLKTKMELKTIIDSKEEIANINSSDSSGMVRREIFNDMKVARNSNTNIPRSYEAILDNTVEFRMNNSGNEEGTIKSHCIHCADAEHGLSEVVVVKDYAKNFNPKTSTCSNIKNTYVPDNAIGDSKVESAPQTTFMAYNVTTAEKSVDPLNFKGKLALKKSSANSAGDKLDDITTSPNKDDIEQGMNETTPVGNCAESNQSEIATKDETVDNVERKEKNPTEDGVFQIDNERAVGKVGYIEKVLLTEKDMNMKNEENEKFICFGIRKLEENLEDILYSKFPSDDLENKPEIKSIVKNQATMQKKVTFSEESPKAEDDVSEIHSNESVEGEKEQESVVPPETPSDQEEDTLSDLLDPVLIPKSENPVATEIIEALEDQPVTMELKESIRKRSVASPSILEASTKKGESKAKSKKIFPKFFKSFRIKRKKH